MLSDIKIENPVPPVCEEKAFMCGDDNMDIYAETVLHVPAGCKDVYKQAPVWCNFENIIDDQVDGIKQLNALMEIMSYKTSEGYMFYIDEEADWQLIGTDGIVYAASYGEKRFAPSLSQKGMYILNVKTRSGNMTTRKLTF